MIKTDGIVFRTMKYRETSLIIDVFTKELGLRSYMVNGVRSAKAKSSANVLQAMNQLDLTVYDKQGPGKLNRIKEFRFSRYYDKLQQDVIRSMVGQFMIEVARNCIKDEEANYPVYEFVIEWFNFLDETPNKIANLIPLFLVQLANQVGFGFSFMEEEVHDYFDLMEGQFQVKPPEHKYYIEGEVCDVLFAFVHSLRNITKYSSLKLKNCFSKCNFTVYYS